MMALDGLKKNILDHYRAKFKDKNLMVVKKCEDFIEDYFKRFGLLFYNMEIKTFLTFSEEQTAAIRERYMHGASYEYLTSNYNIKDPYGLIMKFGNKLKEELDSEINKNLFSYEYPGENSIIELKSFLGERAYHLLEKIGYKTIQQLTKLTLSEVRSIWADGVQIGDKIINAVHSLGFLFEGEVLTVDDCATDDTESKLNDIRCKIAKYEVMIRRLQVKVDAMKSEEAVLEQRLAKTK